MRSSSGGGSWRPHGQRSYPGLSKKKSANLIHHKTPIRCNTDQMIWYHWSRPQVFWGFMNYTLPDHAQVGCLLWLTTTTKHHPGSHIVQTCSFQVPIFFFFNHCPVQHWCPFEAPLIQSTKATPYDTTTITKWQHNISNMSCFQVLLRSI